MGRRDGLVNIGAVDVHGPTSGRLTCLDVPPPIAGHEALFKVDAMVLGRAKQHARSRLPAHASIVVIVRTDEDVVDRQQATQKGVDRLHRLS